MVVFTSVWLTFMLPMKGMELCFANPFHSLYAGSNNYTDSLTRDLMCMEPNLTLSKTPASKRNIARKMNCGVGLGKESLSVIQINECVLHFPTKVDEGCCTASCHAGTEIEKVK